MILDGLLFWATLYVRISNCLLVCHTFIHVCT